MGMRVTTGMAMNTYRYNLQQSTQNRNNSMNKVLTHRQFNSFAENPSSAIQAWRVRRAMINNEIYTKNNKDTFTRFDISYATMQQVNYDLENLGGKKSSIYAANDPTGVGRPELGKVLSDVAESVIHNMNSAKSGENFVFAGNDELNAPFTWSEDKKTLYYRGVNVNAGMVKSPTEVPDWAPEKMEPDPEYPADSGKMINVGANNDDNKALAETFKKNLPDTAEEMNEALWIDYYKGKDGVEMPKYTAGDSETFPSWVPTKEVTIPDPNDPTNTNTITVKVPIERLEDTSTDPSNPSENDKLEAYAQAFRDSLPKKGSAEYEEASSAEKAWIDYYSTNDPANLKPSTDPREKWEELGGGKDDYGVPKLAFADDINKVSYNKAWAEYYKDQGDVEKLRQMSEEEVPIDLGMGMMEDDNGKLVTGTYFDRSNPGINMLGWGVDEDGDPKNVCMIMKELGAIYSRCSGEDGSYASKEDYDDAMRLMNKLKAGHSYTTGQFTDIAAKSSFLEDNQDRLKLQGGYLDEQRAGLEDIDPADAIQEFSWDYYCYSAALKVGTQLLSQSLIDYMT